MRIYWTRVARPQDCLILRSGRRKRPNATVWPNGTWHTWDREGVGAENGAEPGDVFKAIGEAERACIRQGFINASDVIAALMFD